MGKVIKMIDLLNMLFKKEIKDKQKFRVTLGSGMTRDIYYVESEGCNICCFKHCSDDYWWTEEIDLNDKVEILENEEEIDIQSIEELKFIEMLRSVDEKVSREENLRRIDKAEVDFFHKINDILKQQNKILQWAKQLDNKINKLESNT